MEYKKFQKVPRLNRDIIITEKIDGTNAQIFIGHHALVDTGDETFPFMCVDDYIIAAGSRKRWLSVEKDNYGFGRWVSDNRESLIDLGPGYHAGEWWGQGVQRKYGLNEKRFSLFNVSMWNEDTKPDCCHVVPTLYTGPFSQGAIDDCVEELRLTGSVAAPGFMNPEGVIVFHTASNHMYKVTCKNDEVPKVLVKL